MGCGTGLRLAAWEGVGGGWGGASRVGGRVSLREPEREEPDWREVSGWVQGCGWSLSAGGSPAT